MGRRSEHSREELHEMTLEATRSLIRAQGLSGVSGRKIASRIGYTVGTLYVVFHNLDEILLRVNAGTLDSLKARLASAAAGSGTGEVRLLALAQAYLGFAESDPHLWRAVFDLRLSEDAETPQWLSDRVESLFALVRDALRELEPRLSDDQLREAANALWGGVHGVCMLATTGKIDFARGSSPAALVENLVRLYLIGLKVRCG